MFRSNEDDDHYVDYEEYLDLEGGADDGKATPAKAEASAAKAEATPEAAAHEPKFDA
jgi:hypothetical protein